MCFCVHTHNDREPRNAHFRVVNRYVDCFNKKQGIREKKKVTCLPPGSCCWWGRICVGENPGMFPRRKNVCTESQRMRKIGRSMSEMIVGKWTKVKSLK